MFISTHPIFRDVDEDIQELIVEVLFDIYKIYGGADEAVEYSVRVSHPADEEMRGWFKFLMDYNLATCTGQIITYSNESVMVYRLESKAVEFIEAYSNL